MWSHYADQHRGICIEYDMSDHDCAHLKPVEYDRPRSLRVSEIIQWKIQKLAAAERRVIGTYFFSNAPQWRYEREWRDVYASNGVVSAPFRVSAVYFGLRCDPAVRTAVVKLLSSVPCFDVYPLEDGFRLRRRGVDRDDIEMFGVRSAMRLEFDKVVVDDAAEK